MADLSNWLGDLWEGADGPGGTARETVNENLYDWADDDSLETAFATAGRRERRKAPTAMAELSATARRPDRADSPPEPEGEAVVAPATPEPEVAAIPLSRHPVMMASTSRPDDDILPNRRPSGGRLVALRMSIRKR